MATNAQPLGANHALRAALTTLVRAPAAGSPAVSPLGAVQTAPAPTSGATGARPVGRFASFALDAETNAAAAFASLLSLASAALALVLARLRPGKIPRWALVIVAAVLAYLALDEWFEVHERLPELFGISRRLYFAPAALVAFAGWFAVWKELRRRRVRTYRPAPGPRSHRAACAGGRRTSRRARSGRRP